MQDKKISNSQLGLTEGNSCLPSLTFHNERLAWQRRAVISACGARRIWEFKTLFETFHICLSIFKKNCMRLQHIFSLAQKGKIHWHTQISHRSLVSAKPLIRQPLTLMQPMNYISSWTCFRVQSSRLRDFSIFCCHNKKQLHQECGFLLQSCKYRGIGCNPNSPNHLLHVPGQDISCTCLPPSLATQTESSSGQLFSLCMQQWQSKLYFWQQ